MHKNQKGFGHIGIILIIGVVTLVGLSGWFVWKNQEESVDKSNTASSAAKSDDPEKDIPEEKIYETPKGYRLFENSDLGFTFAYPVAYDVFAKLPTENNVNILTSAQPETPYGPGIEGSIRVFTYPSANSVIVARKYGPKVKLQGDKVVVTEANQSDIGDNKVGDEYKDFNGNIAKMQRNGDLNIFTLISSDEGSTSNRFVFVSNNKLHELYLPSFADGLYSTDSTVANDKTVFDELASRILDSIRLSN